MDLAFCSYHENSQNHWIPFLEDEIWAVVPNGHPLADCEELSLAQLAAAILGDQHRVLPVSVLLEGEYGQQGVHCGVPCRIGRRGIEEIVVLDLTEEEQQQLDASCQVIRKHIALADSL